MKSIIFALFAVSIQVQAFPSLSELQEKTWDDAIRRLDQLEEKVDEEYAYAYELVLEAEFDFHAKEKSDSVMTSYAINETTAIYLNQLDEWIEKAEDKQINPSKCTGDRNVINNDLPLATEKNIRICWLRNKVWDELNTALRNLTIIPNRINDLRNKLHNCREDNDACIKNVMAEIEQGFKVMPKDIQEYGQEVENDLTVLIDVLETCIRGNLKTLKTNDEELTNKGIECIKSLINK